MSDELLPCPFCGGSDIKAREYLPENFSTYFWIITCEDCSVGFEFQHNEKKARLAWNTRATPTGEQ